MGSSSESGDFISSPTNRSDDDNIWDALLNAEPGNFRELDQSTAEAVVERGASYIIPQQSSQYPGPGEETDINLIAIQSGNGSVSRPPLPPTENAPNDNGVDWEVAIEEMVNFLYQSGHGSVSRPPLAPTENAPNNNCDELDDDLMDEIINICSNEIEPVDEE